MATATARAPNKPATQKGRPVMGGGLSIDHNSSNATDNNLSDRRIQRLVDHYGLTERRARVAADLIWGAANA